MFSYLKKFNNLPADLKQKISSREIMAAIEILEKKYELPLAPFIMKVMVKEIAFTDLALFLIKENLTEAAAGQLAEELKEKIFFSLGNYFSPPAYPPLGQGSGPAEPERSSIPVPKKEPPSAFKTPAAAARPAGRPAVKGASFFFSPDDEREIKELTEKIGLTEKIELPAGKIEAELKAIISRAQINFGSADLADRFKQILKTYLRGIRNKLETELTLTKPFSSGGLSFDADSARKVTAMADKIVSKLSSPAEPIIWPEKIKIPGREKGAENKPAIVRDAPYDFSKLAKEKKNFNQFQVEDTKHELAPLTPARLTDAPRLVREAGAPVSLAESGAARPAEIAAKLKPAAPSQVKKPLPARAESKVSVLSDEAVDASQMPLVRLRFQAENLSQSQKVKVEDVKYVPRVMSPLDEIKYLDLINFRRLDKDPLAAINKIKNKINLLEEEGYGKKLEGIKLWRSSPLNKLYLEIGHLSISENRPVDVIIEGRKAKTDDYLTAAEFKAIMDLNRSLRF